jgi:4-amino-4-deoxy-L-arabinose transferase-like glycosyltransferase
MKRLPWLAPLLCAPLFLAGLGGTGLADPDEGRNAEVGREMLASGDYVTPRLNGAVYLDKPPVFFWMVAGALAAFGTNEAAARLPSALAAVAGVALTVWFARRRFGPRVAACAAAILALSPLYLVFARLVIFDMLLLVWTTTSTLLFYEAMEGERPSRWLGVAGFAAAGLGTITKGPVALVVPLLVAVAWALVERRPSLLLRLRPGVGMLAYAVVVLPWLLVVERRHPGFLAYAVLGENLARMTANPYDTARPFHFYLQVMLPGLFPWILLLAAQGIGLAWGRLRRRPAAAATAPPAGHEAAAADAPPGEARAARFVGLWLAVIVVFFSLVASKRPSYILPASIPVAILAARLIVRGSRAATRDAALRAAGTVTAAVATVALAATAWVAAGGAGPAALGRVGRAARDAGVAPILLWAAAAALLAGALLLFAVRRTARPALYVAAAALPIVALLPVARAATRHIDALRSSRGVSVFLQGRLAGKDRVVCFEEYRPGLNFYLQRPIGQVTRAGRIFTSNYIAAHLEALRAADPEFRLMEPAELQAALRDPGALTYVLSPRKEYDALRRTAGVPMQPIWEAGGFGLFLPVAEVTGGSPPPSGTGG